jgi:ATP/maltotriose-dependent transcriptional regulator MalT
VFELLQMSARVTALSAPAGSGKTVLLGSWISQEGLGERVAWVRHGQAAGDWASAGRLLADHWPGLQLNGQAATVHALLARFPAEVRAADPELAVLAAADQLAAGSLAEAGRLLELAERGTKSVPPDGGEAAPGAGHHAGAADRPAVPGVHRPGSPHVGRQRAVIALRDGGGARPADDRAGPAARLGRRARRGHCLHRATERLSMLLHAPDWPLTRTRALRLHALVRLGETRRAEQDIADLSQQARASGEIHVAVAALRIRQGDPRAAAVELAPVLSGAASVPPTTWLAHAYVLAAIARDALGDPSAAADALRRALDLAEVDGAVAAFLYHPPTRELFDRHARDPNQQSPLAAEIRTLLLPHTGPGALSRPTDSPRMVDPLSQSEIRVLRYLPTNLSAAEIAGELTVSVTTVRTHIRHLFRKLAAHRRTEAVLQARALGLLAPSPEHPEND